MKADKTTTIYKKAGYTENHTNINALVKAVVITLDDKDIIVTNDNFRTRRKYADFTKGKKDAGLKPMQVVFCGIELAKIFNERFNNADGKVCYFRDYFKKQGGQIW